MIWSKRSEDEAMLFQMVSPLQEVNLSRVRLRELGITIGSFPTGEYNAITDVAGVQVGHATILYDQPRIARTSVTMIVPRQGQIWSNNCYVAFHSL